jgi:sugar (pentulose or hexulose) kinase
MTGAIDKLCSAGGQRVPVSAPEYARVVYRSLGRLISGNVKRLSAITGQKFRQLFIMGGGSRSATLCDIIGAETGLGIIRGPAEASASGNILLQAAAAGELDSPAKIERAARSLFTKNQEKIS